MTKNPVKETELTSTLPTGITIGLDLGDRWSRYCVLDPAGTITKEDRVRTAIEALREHFDGMSACGWRIPQVLWILGVVGPRNPSVFVNSSCPFIPSLDWECYRFSTFFVPFSVFLEH
jgi:hypothetical protein